MADRQKEVEVYDTPSNLGAASPFQSSRKSMRQPSRCASGTDTLPSTGGKLGGNGMAPCSAPRP